MTATGKVTTQFLDQAKDKSIDSSQTARITKVSSGVEPAKPATAPIYTVVTSDQMIYTDTDRVAHYSGGVMLNRPGLNVKSTDLIAYLNPKDTTEDSRLNRAIGDGKVEIVESAPERHRGRPRRARRVLYDGRQSNPSRQSGRPLRLH